MFTIKVITPQNKFQQFKQKWNSIPKKFRINLIALALLVLVIPISITAVLNQVRIRSNASINPSGTVTFTIPTPPAPLTINTSYPLPVTIDTGSSKVTGASVELLYDPAKIQINSVTQGDFLTNVLANPKIENGKITFTFAAPPESGGKQDSGTLATIELKPLVIGKAHIFFSNNSLAAAIGFSDNVLKTAEPVALTIISPSPSPSPNPSPSPSPSLSPSPSPSLSPSPSPSPLANPADLVDTEDKPGDEVNIYDYSQFVSDFGKIGEAGWIRADIDKNGKVDIFDYILFVKEYDK